jgi:hypothetical protein
MENEKVNKICQQLDLIKKLNFPKKDGSQIGSVKKIWQKIIKDSLQSPEKNVIEICQLIKKGQLKNIKNFHLSIYRLLQTEQLTKEGVEQIIKTIKDYYQIN